jgi:hypothetical protein
MDEIVARAVLVGDEAITFVGVEEFYGADRHETFLSRKRSYHRPMPMAPGSVRKEVSAIRGRENPS